MEPSQVNPYIYSNLLILRCLSQKKQCPTLWRSGCSLPKYRAKSLKEKRSMSEFQDSAIAHTTGTPRWVGLAVAVLGGVSLLGLGVSWSALNQAKTVEQSTQATVKQSNEALSQRLGQAHHINQQLQSDVRVVTDTVK